LSLHSSEAPLGIGLSCSLFTYTNANQAATCTCNTRTRVSPHHVVNHSSQPGATIHRSSDALVVAYSKTLHDSPRAKLVRPVWETGQASFAWTVGKNTTRGKNSTFQVIDLPVRSMDQSETLGIARVPRGQPLARSSVPKTRSLKRNRKSTLKNTFPWKPPKAPKSKPFRRDC
jgi:hypothetical protein